MDRFLQAETLVIELLLIASLVAIAVQRLRIPYTVALVVVGLLITSQSPLEINLTPELILALFVPPLVFEAAFHLNIDDLRRNIAAILLLAVPGVLITMVIVGGMVAWLTPLSIALAFVFGAMIAATDPVAVVAIFRGLGVPRRLGVLVEGESLLNDGTAIVVFNLVLAVALTGHFSVLEGVADFIRVAVGGLTIGFLLGWIISRLIASIDNYLIETTLTTVLAFGAYLIAERLHFSGVLAVVAAGLVSGNVSPQGMSPTTRIVLFNFWEYVAFLANSLIFLLIGLRITVTVLLEIWPILLVTVGSVLLARITVVYGLGFLSHRLAEPVPLRWQHVIAWGGLRGAISLALALSLPATLGSEKELILLMVFGVVLFTLLIQATTMAPLIRRLKINARSEAHTRYELHHARLTALRAAENHLDRMHGDGLLSTPTWEKLKAALMQNADILADEVRNILNAEPGLEAEELDTGWREVLRAQRGALQALRRDGVISEEVFEELVSEVDSRLQEGYLEPESKYSPLPRFSDLALNSESPAVGKTVAQLGLPRSTVIVCVRRGNEVIIPRGDTLLKDGDLVTFLSESGGIEDARQIFY